MLGSCRAEGTFLNKYCCGCGCELTLELSVLHMFVFIHVFNMQSVCTFVEGKLPSTADVGQAVISVVTPVSRLDGVNSRKYSSLIHVCVFPRMQGLGPMFFLLMDSYCSAAHGPSARTSRVPQLCEGSSKRNQKGLDRCGH